MASRTLRRSAALVPLALAPALVLAVAVAPSASAGVRNLTDGRGDAGADITSVKVRWADALTVTVGHARDLRSGDLYRAYIDTDPDDAGPEYQAYAQPTSDVLGVRRVSSWDARGTAVRCPGFRARADTFGGSDPVTFTVPGSCLGDPDGRVRVSVRFERGSASDWAPGARRFGPSVKRY